jgi:putative ABC transport system permease protein
MRPLTWKLLRDLWYMRGQVAAIALVIGAGICAVLMSYSTLDSLKASRAKFYAEHGFAQVFAPLKRAPQALLEQAREIPGIGIAEARVVSDATVSMPGYPDPIRGLVVSAPEGLNRLHLNAGRLPEPRRDDEIVLGEAFATAHGIELGDHLAMTLRGKRINPRIVGIALSPEYIYQAGPGEILPDFKRYAIVWMDREPLSMALDMDGAFNDLVATIAPSVDQPGMSPVSTESVLEQVDLLLARWGGLGSYAREDQQSHKFLSLEFQQLQHMGRMFSVIFLSILAFLLHIVMSRLIDTQRDQVAILKAFGYTNANIGSHFAQMVLVIVVLGVALGIVGGIQMGSAMAEIYKTYYRLPEMVFTLRAEIVVRVVLVAVIASLAGAGMAVWKAVRLPPAEGMRPDPPAEFRKTLVERLGLQRWLAPVTRMIFRQMERRPWRAAFTTIGIAMATGVMISGLFFPDSMDFLVETEFHRASREDLAAVFIEPTERRAMHELAGVHGVERVEPYRTVSIKMRHQNLMRRTIIQGFDKDMHLHRLLDERMQPVTMPEAGLLVSNGLAELLNIRPGDLVEVEVLEGRRHTRLLQVTGTVEQFVGIGAYMSLDALNRFMMDPDLITGVFLAVGPGMQDHVVSELERRPWIAGTRSPALTVKAWNESFQEVILTFTGFITAMAMAISLGVVYNGARIALSERSRELASMRVLGFTRAEISRILLGELALLVLIGIPLGFYVGYWLARLFADGAPKELFVIPVVISTLTYTKSALAVLLASGLSAVLIKKKLNGLDLVSALKSRE